jgi:hypothetical protein
VLTISLQISRTARWDRSDRSGRPWSARYPAIRKTNADRSTRPNYGLDDQLPSPKVAHLGVSLAPTAYRPWARRVSYVGYAGGVGTWLMDGVVLARAHGVANLVGGLWPLLHISSFEMVFGPKTDRWLVKTVAGLLMVNGITQLTTSSTASGVRQARRLGVGTAALLAVIDLVYVPARRISKMYLVDAALEVGWILAWCRIDKPAQEG